MAHRTPAIFIADAPALDFLNSIATPVDTPVDWIDGGEGLLNWLEQAGMISAETLHAMRNGADPGDLDKAADQARKLREWFRRFVSKHGGRPPASRDLRELEPLNRLLGQDEIFKKIVPDDETNPRSLTLETMRRWRSPDSLLLPIAEALAQFVCSEDFSRVRACQGAACTLLFADHTRGRARRWCSMAICGNRAKQAAYRERSKAQRQRI